MSFAEEDEVLKHLLTVGLSEPADGSGMLERVLRYNGYFDLLLISDLTVNEINYVFYQLDVTGQPTTIPLTLGDKLTLHRLASFTRTYYGNLPDYATWMNFRRRQIINFDVCSWERARLDLPVAQQPTSESQTSHSLVHDRNEDSSVTKVQVGSSLPPVKLEQR